MKMLIRTVKEEEIVNLEGLFANGDEDWERQITAQYHRQKELLIGAIDGTSGKILGVVLAQGQGDTVVIRKLAVKDEPSGELRKRLLMAEEKVARHYGYLQICLTAAKEEKNFLLNMGYKPRLTFTFSERRREVLGALAELYPMWIEAGGQQVKVILGGDHLDEEAQERLSNLPIVTELLFVKLL